MALVSSKEILLKAQKEGYAVGAFNAENMEMVQAIVAAAEELSSPVIIQTTPGSLQYADTDMFFGMVNAEAKKAKVPVALHLDHGNSAELCSKAIFSGYTSIMIDGSKLTFSENVALTKKVVEFAHAMDVPVEGELGTVGGKEDTHEVKDSERSYTDPKEAKEFAEQTGVDFLAVGIGNAHGFYKGIPKLRFDILEQTKSLVTIPIVLHGASGIPDEDVKRSTGLGICKVNFATELRDAFTQGVKEYLEKNPEVFDPKKYNGAGREKVKELIKHKIQVLNSANKA
ncbi:class II fructose-1,6-bisphosphate aldolase [Oribacterium parvum]